MSEHNIIVEGGTSVRLKTAGKYCDRDILITAEGGGGYKIKSFKYFCYEGSRLEELGSIDMSQGTDFERLFYYCSDLTSDEIPPLNTSNGVNFRRMFGKCNSLVSAPYFDTSKGESFREMFKECPSLISVPLYDTSNGENFREMFCDCTSLVSIPELDTSKGTDFRDMFKNCTELTSIPKLDFLNAEDTEHVGAPFNGCVKLTHLRLYNITKSVAIGTETYGQLLDVDSLVHAIKELHETGEIKTLTIGSVNLEKISNLYCKVIDDTTVKIEMELCDSTDDGAMTLAEYAALKSWELA